MEKGKTIPSKEISKNGGLVRPDKNLVIEELPNEERLKILEDLGKHFKDDISYVDSFKYINPTGGSGGLYRYRMLVKFSKDKAQELGVKSEHILELKEMDTPGSFPVAISHNPSREEHLIETIKAQHGGENVSPFYAPINSTRAFYMRPRWEGIQKIELSDIPESKLGDVIEDELKVIGQLHKNQLTDKANSFSNELSNSAEQFFDAAMKLASKMRESFLTSKL